MEGFVRGNSLVMLQTKWEIGRPIREKSSPRLLRLSVTDRCNFRCRYCMPPGGVPKLAHGDVLSLEEMATLAAWLARRIGIERIKLTGGEPLVRVGLEHLVQQLAAISGVTEISLTSNGSRLSQQAERLKAAGLARVNVSLDSLDGARFRELTLGGKLEQTLAGISAAVAAGLVPVKLNSVLQRSSWKQDVPLLLDYAAENGFELRFIELMRTGTERAWCDSEFVAAAEVQQWLSGQRTCLPMAATGNGPARLTAVFWRGAALSVGWITPRSHPFCRGCGRLRLDARGRLYRCLMDPEFFDLGASMRKHGDQAAEAALLSYLEQKSPPLVMDHPSAMSLIGG
jgi:GTP 3',8-cyclase